MQFDVLLDPTKDEWLDGMRRADLRAASKARLLLQSVLLLAVAAWSLIAFFGDGMKELPSLFIGAAALVLIPVMWFVPAWHLRHTVNQTMESGTCVHMWTFEDGLDFSQNQPSHAYFSFSSLYCCIPEENAPYQTLVIRTMGEDVVVVPRRQLTEEQWTWLCEQAVQGTAEKRRHIG